MKIEVRNLVRTFGTTRAVDDISFGFGSGNIFGFIGPNGAGKSTTIRIMATLDLPDSGDVLFDGMSTVISPGEVRRIVGYMPDSLPDFKDVRVWEYLDFFARSFGLKGRARTQTLADIEEFTELGEIRYKSLAALSKGMKQRVSLARSLVHNPPVLVMDEPAAGLDPRARLDLRRLLKILAGQGKAILLSSHILSELQDICDGAVIIERGRVLSAGTLNEMAQTVESGGKAGDAAPEQTTIVITSLGASALVRGKLLELPMIGKVDVIDDNEVRAVFTGDAAGISAVVKALAAADLPVTGFNRHRMGLEELFMKITTGGVC